MEGDTDMAFRLYEDMQADKVATDPRVYTALISTCSKKIQMSDSDSRREQLVLLERAFGVFHDMQVILIFCQRALVFTTGQVCIVLSASR